MKFYMLVYLLYTDRNFTSHSFKHKRLRIGLSEQACVVFKTMKHTPHQFLPICMCKCISQTNLSISKEVAKKLCSITLSFHTLIVAMKTYKNFSRIQSRFEHAHCILYDPYSWKRTNWTKSGFRILINYWSPLSRIQAYDTNSHNVITYQSPISPFPHLPIPPS